MNIRKYAVLTLASAMAFAASAADFFDTSEPEKTFNIGVHFGVNTSNRTIKKDVFPTFNYNGWGTGIDLGATVDINIRDWISIQPGFFLDTRSGHYAYDFIYVVVDENNQPVLGDFTQLGKANNVNIIIPVLASVHFNITDEVRWNCEIGPYLQLSLHNGFDDIMVRRESQVNYTDIIPETESAKTRSMDFGFKVGTGMTLFSHYNFGIHYLAGCLSPWKNAGLGGSNKQWQFTVGYIF